MLHWTGVALLNAGLCALSLLHHTFFFTIDGDRGRAKQRTEVQGCIGKLVESYP